MCDWTMKTNEVNQVFLSASLQRDLGVAIRGAFEVAVEIAVREVTEIVGHTADGILEVMRKENESLRQRLEQAEAVLDSLEERGTIDSLNVRNNSNVQEGCDNGSSAHQNHVPAAKNQYNCCRTFGAPQLEDLHDEGPEESADQNAAVEASVGKIDFTTQNSSSKEKSHDPIVVKQEKHEEESDSSTSSLDFIKVENLGLECESAEQSRLLEEWQDAQHQNTQSCSRLIEGHDPDMSTRLPHSDNPLLSSDFPNIPQLPELTESNPQVSGVHTPSRRPHQSCKYCGLTFQPPSLLRHHQGHCRLELQQGQHRPAADNKRTRLQLYPPGCSPFRCTVCSREFNRMENLKSHLRIHTGERPYTCSVCFKCFRHSGALTRHFRIHTGEKPYMCGQCGKSFRNCGGLKIHQRTHR